MPIWEKKFEPSHKFTEDNCEERDSRCKYNSQKKWQRLSRRKSPSGGYASAAEFIADIVLRADEFNRLKLERLRGEVNIGLEEIKRGEVVEFDLEDILNADVK
jgi:hypothetical protein